MVSHSITSHLAKILLGLAHTVWQVIILKKVLKSHSLKPSLVSQVLDIFWQSDCFSASLLPPLSVPFKTMLPKGAFSYAVFSWFDSNPGMFSLSVLCRWDTAFTLRCETKQPVHENLNKVVSVPLVESSMVQSWWKNYWTLNQLKWRKLIFWGCRVNLWRYSK